MRISDWSSDVCSSDLFRLNPFAIDPQLPRARPARNGGKAHQRQVTLEPAVEPYPVVVGGDGKLADLLRFGSIHAANRMTTRRSEEHTSELQSLMRSSYAVFCLKKKKLITQ